MAMELLIEVVFCLVVIEFAFVAFDQDLVDIDVIL